MTITQHIAMWKGLGLFKWEHACWRFALMIIIRARALSQQRPINLQGTNELLLFYRPNWSVTFWMMWDVDKWLAMSHKSSWSPRLLGTWWTVDGGWGSASMTLALRHQPVFFCVPFHLRNISTWAIRPNQGREPLPISRWIPPSTRFFECDQTDPFVVGCKVLEEKKIKQNSFESWSESLQFGL